MFTRSATRYVEEDTYTIINVLEALESFEKTKLEISFPVAEASVVGGLFMVLFIEQVVLELKERGFFGQNHINLHEHDHEHSHAVVDETEHRESKLGSFLLV